MLRDAGVDYVMLLPRRYEGNVDADFFPQAKASCVMASVDPYPYDFDEPAKPDYIERVNTLMMGDSTGLGYRALIPGFSHVVTHEVAQSPWFLEHRQAIEKTWKPGGPHVFHFCHNNLPTKNHGTSFPYQQIYETMHGATFVYPSQCSAARARSLLPDSADVSFVHNARDLRDVARFSPFSQRLCKLWDLFNHEIMQVYAFDAVRWRSKGVPHLLKLFGSFHRHRRKVKLVLVNANATGQAAGAEVSRLLRTAERYGLAPGEQVHLTSDFYTGVLPHDVVCNLVLLSNLFVFPSEAECCSLVFAEASVSGCLLAVNSGYSPLLEFAGPYVSAHPFSEHDPDHDDEWYNDVAELLIGKLEIAGHFDVAHARRETYNRDWIWEHQFLPLLEGSWQ